MSLLLEYCSKGNLRKYLINNRTGFENSLDDYNDTGRVENIGPSDIDGLRSSITILYKWAFQVNYTLSNF